MKMKKWSLVVLMTLLISTGAAAVTVWADGYDRSAMVAQEEWTQGEAQTLYSSTSAAALTSSKAWQKINGVCYNGSGKVLEGAITRGIDVSEWQGTIDWKKVKNSNVDFAFVRISYGRNYLDKKYDYNMKQAEAAGVPVGTYVYSLATTTSEALKEAQLAIQKMNGYKVSYPVVFDLEDSKMGSLSKSSIAKIAKTFCDEIKKAGYYPMVYCNTYWYQEKVDWSLLSGVDVWIAQYGDKILAPSKSTYRYSIWQSTDGDGGGVLNSTKGLISGIPAANDIDVDFGYVDYTKIITPRWKAASSYSTSSSSQTVKNGWVTENGRTYYYSNNVKALGWKKINGKYYYFNKTTGILYKDRLLTSSKWDICYVDKNGARVANQWVDWNGKRYYMGPNEYAVKGFYKIGKYYYFFNSQQGYMFRNRKIVSRAGNVYYIRSNGMRCYNLFYDIKEGGKTYTYYFDKNGRAYKGWHIIKGKKYYFYSSGRMAKNVTLTSRSGVVSVFDKNGVCVKQYKKQ